MTGTLYLCATPIGNLEDITFRVLRTLKEVDLIAAEDTRNSIKLLNHYEIKTPMTSYHEFNKIEKAYQLVEKLQEGMNIALITDAGTPGISDPGEELVEECIKSGIAVTSIPGAAALISAVITSGLCTGRFCFEGFLSVNKKQRREHLEDIRREKRTMIFYEAPHKLRATLKDFYDTLGNRRISIARELTKKFEEISYLTLEEAIEKYEQIVPKGEFVIVIEGDKDEPLCRDYSDLPVDVHVQSYIDGGMSEMEAIKAAAKDRGMRKNEIYAIVKKKQ